MVLRNGYGFRGLASEERVLYGRQRELDIVRGISVFLMVGVHVMGCMYTVETDPGMTQSSPFEILVSNLTGAFPGGSNCFMMVMGMVMLFSTTATYRHFIRRGAMLIAAGFLLEFIKLFPGLVNYALTGNFVSFYPEYDYADVHQLMVITMFWQDILIFAGMAMAFIGILQRFRVSDLGMVLITAAMMVFNQFAQGMHTDSEVLNVLCGYFWGTTVFDANMTISRCPLFGWFVYPMTGYLVAKFMVRVQDKHTFYRNLAVWSGIVLVPLSVLGYMDGMFTGGFTGNAWYFGDILSSLWCTAAALLWIAAIYRLFLNAPDRLVSPIERWSRNVTHIYIIHFAILAVLLQVLPNPLSLPAAIVLILALFGVTDYVSEVLMQRKRAKRLQVPADLCQ